MSLATRVLVGTGVVVMTAGALVFAQGGDAAKVMADVRAALGGEQKLASVTALSGSGNAMRAQGETSTGGDYEFALAMPDKFFSKRVAAETPMGKVILKSGVNGDGLIQDTEQPSAPGGGMVMRFAGPGQSLNATPEQQAEARKQQVENGKQEFARMALGMIGAAPANYPLQYTYSGTAEAPDGKADVLDVKGPGTFTGKLFVDQKSHLPLMFSWMAKEPLILNIGGPGGGGGGANVVRMNAGSQADMEKMMAEADARMKAAEANRKMVEYRVYYGDYKKVDGLMLPHKFQQSVAGAASSEITIDKYKVNPKIDAKQFDIVK